MIFSAVLALASMYYFFIEDPWRLPPTLQLIQNLAISVFLALLFFDPSRYQQIFATVKSSKSSKKLEATELIQKRIIEKITKQIEEDRIYAQENMTISQLSELINEKEYLVRRAINSEMGFTNFNGFLNHFRIKDAKKMIDEDKTRELTFQEIGYRLGYQSIATFNRAFKSETGKTPSEYVESS